MSCESIGMIIIIIGIIIWFLSKQNNEQMTNAKRNINNFHKENIEPSTPGPISIAYPSENNPAALPWCVNVHSQNPMGRDYEWLDVLKFGKVLKVEFEEPAGSGNWKMYTDKWWGVHCKAIDHSPDKLVDAHVKAFINPDTKFANLRFYFEKLSVPIPPEKHWYELEAAYFKNGGKTPQWHYYQFPEERDKTGGRIWAGWGPNTNHCGAKGDCKYGLTSMKYQ